MKNSKEINIGGKLRPVYFGINTAVFICEKLGITLAEYTKRFSVDGLQGGTGREMRMMLYAGLVSGADYSKIPVDFTETEVGYWMDDFEIEELSKVFQIIKEGNPVPVEEKKTDIGENPK